MLNSLLQVWVREPNAENSNTTNNNVNNNAESPNSPRGGFWGGSTALSRTLRPLFIILLVLQVCLIVLRWRVGDAHGALLMFVVFAVGAVAAAVDSNGIDVVYGGYFGLMAFVSGFLDLNVAIEKIVWSQWHHKALSKGDFSGLTKPLIYIACALTQLVAAFVAYVLYKDAEALEEAEADMPLFATQEQALIYNAVLSHTDRRNQAAVDNPQLKPFHGSAQKLP